MSAKLQSVEILKSLTILQAEKCKQAEKTFVCLRRHLSIMQAFVFF